MRVLTSFTFGPLFFLGSFGILLSALVLLSDTPWELDPPFFNHFIRITDEEIAEGKDWFEKAGEYAPIIREMALVHWRFSAACLLLLSCILEFIIFFATNKRPLIFSTIVAFFVFFGVLWRVFKSFPIPTIFQRIYYFSFLTTGIAVVSYCGHLWLRRRIRLRRKRSGRQVTTPKESPKDQLLKEKEN
eukprot:TRINITY_DN82768_c0_g1_i1.p1 TRINITY_DN82768_c0_g1~~TRINITY_DN82768_c0_g1_i1.p1  ORF type:complete len:188 (+),score=39.13 TRINITY_DN82768_c0_g1_i1:94-657(+)